MINRYAYRNFCAQGAKMLDAVNDVIDDVSRTEDVGDNDVKILIKAGAFLNALKDLQETLKTFTDN